MKPNEKNAPPPRATREETRARYHGLDDHVRSTGFEAAWIGLQGVVLAVMGALMIEDAALRAAAFVGAVLLIAIAIGVARAAEWSRIAGGVASLLLAVYGIAQPFLPRPDGGPAASPKYFVILIGLSTGIHLLLPKTGAAFRAARENRERSRAAKLAA